MRISELLVEGDCKGEEQQRAKTKDKDKDRGRSWAGRDRGRTVGACVQAKRETLGMARRSRPLAGASEKADGGDGEDGWRWTRDGNDMAVGLVEWRMGEGEMVNGRRWMVNG
ncbi:uncharacterized protein PV09_05160 [Verruconis gallopava]|uniref:Uncharacterized protein n=1 Tax=Verruconis gallopava TaxID=253628 RepID=A0A0D2AAQ7_9PEZI|nr:uncharacterized protein PV09_05160 [Verruconis gallopava]KIW03863.1 hypothetical protein PV09_05160 [Verruconis gallopava]